MDDFVGFRKEDVGGEVMSHGMIEGTRRLGPLTVVAAVVVLTGCAGTTPPVIDPAFVVMEQRPTVIFVSGLTGSVLYDREEGRVAWGNFRSALFPRDFGYEAVHPIGPAEDRIEGGDPILEVTVGPLYRFELYRPLVHSLEANGYRTGVDLFLYGYDWRLSNVESARGLARLIDEVGGRGPVVLVCQSNGGNLCRWAVRFGDVGLDEAEHGVVRRPRAAVSALVLVGTTHAGSIRILREVDRGRTYVRHGRFLSPELFFTFESLYQDLPTWRDDLFVDEQGRHLDVDLFDAATWERYEWSIFRKDARERADRRPDLFGSREDRLAFLQNALDDARRFNDVLRDGPGPPSSVRYYSIQNRTHRTIDRAMVVERNGEWQTLFIGDELVDSHPELEPIMTTMGDVHASAAGQEALPAEEKARFAEPTIEVEGDHLGVVRGVDSHKAILRILRESRGESLTAEVERRN